MHESWATLPRQQDDFNRERDSRSARMKYR